MNAEHSLHNKICLVTGGGAGIGKATARTFLAQAATVALLDHDKDALGNARKELADEFGAERIITVIADVSDWHQVKSAVETIVDEQDGIDILVNNAGVAHRGVFAEQAPQEIEQTIRVNVTGALYCTRAVLPIMHERQHGIIVNVSSGAGLTGIPELAAYSASKFALVGFTEAIAEETMETNIDAYAVCPGRVATEMQKRLFGDYYGMTPEYLADRILALVDDEPPIASGEYLYVPSE